VIELGNSDRVLQRAERRLYLDTATLLEAPPSPPVWVVLEAFSHAIGHTLLSDIENRATFAIDQ